MSIHILSQIGTQLVHTFTTDLGLGLPFATSFPCAYEQLYVLNGIFFVTFL